jgi:hypothetical protein
MKEEQIYLGGVGWSWFGCYSLWIQYLSISVLEPYKLLCNGQNFPLIGQVRYTFTPSFGNMDAGRTDVLGNTGRPVLVLVGLLQPMAPIFEYWIRSLLDLYRLLCNGQNFPLIGKVEYTNHTMLEKSV